jgi:ribonuclease P/MRP protein subunit POP5
MVWAAITFVTTIHDQPCAIRVLHCGGTIRSCQKATVKFDQQLLILLKDSKNKKDYDMEYEADTTVTGFGV